MLTNITNTISELDAIIAKLTTLLAEQGNTLEEFKTDFGFWSDAEVVDAFKQAMLNAPDTYITQLCKTGVIKPLNFTETERYVEPSITNEVFGDLRRENEYCSAEERDQERLEVYESEQKTEPLGGSYAEIEAPDLYLKWEAQLRADGLALIA